MKAALCLCIGRMIERLSVDLDPDACKSLLAILGDAVLHLGELGSKAEAAESERFSRELKAEDLERLSVRVRELEIAAELAGGEARARV